MNKSRVQTLKPTLNWIAQAARFGLVGVTNTLLDLGLYYLLTRSIDAFATLPVAAKVISYSIGLLNSYFLNRQWTFQSRASNRRALPLFAAASLGGLALNALVLNLALNRLGLGENASLLLATCASLGWNFLASKYLVFREAQTAPGKLARTL